MMCVYVSCNVLYYIMINIADFTTNYVARVYEYALCAILICLFVLFVIVFACWHLCTSILYIWFINWIYTSSGFTIKYTYSYNSPINRFISYIFPWNSIFDLNIFSGLITYHKFVQKGLEEIAYDHQIRVNDYANSHINIFRTGTQEYLQYSGVRLPADNLKIYYLYNFHVMDNSNEIEHLHTLVSENPFFHYILSIDMHKDIFTLVLLGPLSIFYLPIAMWKLYQLKLQFNIHAFDNEIYPDMNAIITVIEQQHNEIEQRKAEQRELITPDFTEEQIQQLLPDAMPDIVTQFRNRYPEENTIFK